MQQQLSHMDRWPGQHPVGNFVIDIYDRVDRVCANANLQLPQLEAKGITLNSPPFLKKDELLSKSLWCQCLNLGLLINVLVVILEMIGLLIRPEDLQRVCSVGCDRQLVTVGSPALLAPN